MSGILPADPCERYAALYPDAVTDVLDDRGYEDLTLAPEIGPVESGMTLAGIVHPCVGGPNRSVDENENIRNIPRMLGDAPENSVVRYETNADDSAQIGDLSVEYLVENGARRKDTSSIETATSNSDGATRGAGRTCDG